MNLSLYGYDGDWIAVDCGMMIRQDLPDQPLQIPDVEHLAAHAMSPSAVFITHGHEDHLGALAWIWPRWNCPVYATPLAIELLRAKFIEQGLRTDALKPVQPGTCVTSGAFEVTFLPVTHSIPESCALSLVTPRHRVLHTGDWKLDERPLIGAPLSASQFETLAPVDLVVADSTNADVEGHSRSETEAASALEAVIQNCRGRVVVSCFASNIARIKALGGIAERSGRRVALLGRSMERMVSIALQLGYLDDFPPRVPTHDLGYLYPEEVLIIATGSQGEPRSALSRMAQGRHPALDLQPQDDVIFSARAIPGNERQIERLKAGFKRLGVNVHDEHTDPALHASGHPAREELRQLYRWLKPKLLLPVHGEASHQEAHRELAADLGIHVPHLVRNGTVLALEAETLVVRTQHHLRPQLIGSRARAGDPTQPVSARKHSHSLSIALNVLPTETGWTRIGRLLWDSEIALPLDEDSLADWLDERIDTIPAETLLQLRQQLFGPLRDWLRERLPALPEIHLQLMPADPQPEYEVRSVHSR
ncbi:MBL fold metallo-hydrolase [Salinicola socius]|uniref:MBL fold metallo-hydrolase n=2 Tax=Salinicola socius TaxID=404433 RepID=A0A1Q8SRX6_9GAMM|nr:ribonuclease J [Salinicola socius]OLO04200.1 MBL fold metallo-hydrolase [Salinicola socius]